MATAEMVEKDGSLVTLKIPCVIPSCGELIQMAEDFDLEGIQRYWAEFTAYSR